jgi:hypothetical protein
MAWACPPAGSPLFYFCQPISRVSVLVFLLVLVAIDDENCFTFRWLSGSSVIGQGHIRSWRLAKIALLCPPSPATIPTVIKRCADPSGRHPCRQHRNARQGLVLV